MYAGNTHLERTINIFQKKNISVYHACNAINLWEWEYPHIKMLIVSFPFHCKSTGFRHLQLDFFSLKILYN